MATLTLYPNGAGNSSILTPAGDTPNWKCVDEVGSIDSDTTYVYRAGGLGAGLDLYTIDASGVPSGAIIRNVRSVNYSKRAGLGGGTTKAAIRIGGTTYLGVSKSLSTNYSAAVTFTDWATNPNSGVAWTVADMSSLEVGVEAAPGVADARVTSVRIIITYTVPTVESNRIFLIG